MIKQDKETREEQKEKKKDKYNTTKNKKEKHNTHIMYIYIWYWKDSAGYKTEGFPEQPPERPPIYDFSKHGRRAPAKPLSHPKPSSKQK